MCKILPRFERSAIVFASRRSRHDSHSGSELQHILHTARSRVSPGFAISWRPRSKSCGKCQKSQNQKMTLSVFFYLFYQRTLTSDPAATDCTKPQNHQAAKKSKKPEVKINSIASKTTLLRACTALQCTRDAAFELPHCSSCLAHCSQSESLSDPASAAARSKSLLMTESSPHPAV